MFRSIILFLLLLLSFNVSAQPDDWEVTPLNKAAHIVICKQKKKVGIWSKARGDFLIPPHPGHVLHFADAQLLLAINTKKDSVAVFHYYKGSVQALESPNENGNFYFGNINSEQWNEPLKTSPITKETSSDTAKGVHVFVGDKAVRYAEGNRLYYSFYKNYLLVEMSHEYFGSDSDLSPILGFDGFDSVDVKGNIVYHDRKISRFKKSGVFNLETGNWDVPSKYLNVKRWENVLAAYFWPEHDALQSETEYDIKNGMVYDFYVFDKKQGLKPYLLNHQSYGFPLELWPYKVNQVRYDRDSAFIYEETKNGMGLFHVPMTGKTLDEEGFHSLNYYDSDGRMDPNELLPTQYEDILLLGNMDLVHAPTFPRFYYAVASRIDGRFDVLVMYTHMQDEEELFGQKLITDLEVDSYFRLAEAYVCVSDSSVFEKPEPLLITENEAIGFYAMNKGNAKANRFKIAPVKDQIMLKGPYHFELELDDNGYYIVTEYQLEVPDSWSPAYDDNYEQLTDENNELLYYPGEPGIYRSGVYDPSTHQWVIPAEYVQVYPTCGGYLLEKPILDENGYYQGRTISFVNQQLQYEFKDKRYSELVGSDFQKYQINGFNATATQHVSPRNEFVVYFKTDEGIGVGRIIDLSADLLIEPVEAPNYLQNDMIVFVDDDSLQIRILNAIGHHREPLEVGLSWEVGTTYEIRGEIAGVSVDKYGRRSLPERNTFELIAKTDSSRQCFNIERIPVPNGYSFDSLKLKSTKRMYSSAKTDFLDVAVPADTHDEIAWIEIWSDSLVYIRNNQGDEDELIPMMSEIEPGFDSLDLDGNVVYYPPTPGYCGSVVYNRYRKEWVIAPENIGVEWVSNDIFLLHQGLRDENDLLVGSKFILQKGAKQEVIQEGMHKDRFPGNPCGRISDSLIYINHTANTVRLKVLKTVYNDRYGDVFDSIDVNGNVVYEELPPYERKSGVLNVYTNEWIIPQQYDFIVVLDGFFVVVQKELDAHGYPVDAVWPKGQKYAIYDLNGQLIQDFVPMDELQNPYQEKVRKSLG